jgi:hypothetical protein
MLRGAESAIDLRAVNEQIKREQKSFQDSVAQLDQASADKLLAQQLAALDSRQSAIERANARGLTSATQHALALNAVEQQRLATQELALKASLAREQSRLDESAKPEEANAQKAKITQIQGQLIDMQSRLRQAASQGRAIADADALQEAQDGAMKWAQIWQQAFGQVRQFAAENAATEAARQSDPLARADAEAQAKVAATRQQLADLQRDLALRISLTVAPEQKAELQQQLDALGRESAKAISNQVDAAKFMSLRSQWSEVTEGVMNQERALDLQVQQGALTTEQAEQRKFDAREKALPQLRVLLQALRDIAKTDGERVAIDGLLNDLQQLQDRSTELDNTVRGSVKSGFGQMFSDIVTGSQTAGQAFKSFLANVARSALNVIGQRLGEQLASSMMPKGGAGGGTDWISAGIKIFTSLFHSGGVVGSGGPSRVLSLPTLALASAVARAPRYHGGGVSGMDMGLSQNEELAVLLKDEEVLTRDDPRHVLNGGRTVGGVTVNSKVEINGAQGDSGRLRQAGEDLDRRMSGAIDAWAIDQSRPGGILAR